MEHRERPTRFKLEPLLGGVALFLLLAGCVVVLKPFLSALMWAIILSYSLYPLQRRFTGWFRGSRTLAAGLVTFCLMLMLAGPVVLFGFSLVEDGKAVAAATKEWFLDAPDEAPDWIQRVPVLGDEVSAYWRDFSEDRRRWVDDLERAAAGGESPALQGRTPVGPEGGAAAPTEPVAEGAVPAAEADVDTDGERDDSTRLVDLLGRTLGMARNALIATGLAVGQGVTQVALSVFLAFFFLRHADVLAERLRNGVERLAGDNGKRLLKVAGDTVRAVVYGILGTALTQGIVAGFGFWIAGVPGAVLLGMLTFFLAVVLPFGPPIVWIPAMLWLFGQGETGWGIFMLLWGFFAISSVDNVVRPFIISLGTKLPFVLILCGVVGGALAFGLVGVFLGPTMLAVAYRLVDEWATSPADSEKVELPQS
jgi:predicted PurR-regulated permease PerM